MLETIYGGIFTAEPRHGAEQCAWPWYAEGSDRWRHARSYGRAADEDALVNSFTVCFEGELASVVPNTVHGRVHDRDAP